MLGGKGEATPAHTKYVSIMSHAGTPIIKGLKNTLLQQHILTNINDDLDETGWQYLQSLILPYHFCLIFAIAVSQSMHMDMNSVLHLLILYPRI